ncbi:MAG: substrate-binding domain-containing protein [bacterium]|nr:substrate-binding domain-containing protein [bacterium]
MNNKVSHKSRVVCSVLLFSGLIISSCSNNFKNDYRDTSPTSGRLKVYYDEGLTLHVRNQVSTFESQYENASIELYQTSENEAVQALYNDSCELIVISRNLGEVEKKAFASKSYTPAFSAIAKSGVAIITNVQTPLSILSYESLLDLLSGSQTIKDSNGVQISLRVLFDKNNSAILHYMLDSVLKGKNLSPNSGILNSTLESINYVAKNKNTLAFIDFAWISDADDSLVKANKSRIKVLAMSKRNSSRYEFPDQSSFKLNNYPLIRTVFAIRKTGDFTLAKGFESYLAGPKGQLTFLKQGLLPTRQGERSIKAIINTKSENETP